MELELSLMKEEFKDLFEAAGKLSNVKRQVAARTPSQNDLEKQFFDCKTMYEEINRGLEFAFKFAEIDQHSFHTFFLRPQNFSQAEWKSVQEGKTNIEQMLKNLKKEITFQSPESGVGAPSEETPESQPVGEEPQEAQQGQEQIPEQKEQEPQQEKKTKKHMHRTRWIDMR